MATTTAASNRGRRAGTKVCCKPWTATEEALLRALVDAGTKAQQQKKAMWVEIAAQFGSRTVASVEQHFYYMERQQRAKSGTPVTGGGSAPKTKSKVSACAAAQPSASKRAKAEATKGVRDVIPDWSRVEDIDLDEDEAVAGDGEVPQTDDYDEEEEEYVDEDVAEVMRRLEKCDEEGRCFECMRKHRGNSLPYWIPHPADEIQEIQDVEFCYDCYDCVRNARRRELGMSHFSDDDGCDSDSDNSDLSDGSWDS